MPRSEYLVYAGTGAVSTTGVSEQDLGHQEVTVKLCRRVRRSLAEKPQSFAAIVVGSECTIAAEQSGSIVIAESWCLEALPRSATPPEQDEPSTTKAPADENAEANGS